MTPLALLALAKRFWWLGPVIACGILFALWRGAEAEADRYEAMAATERASHEVTLASLAAMRRELDAKNAESDARGRALAQARRDAAQALGEARARYEVTQARIDALRASVGQNDGSCDVPQEVRDALR